MTLGMHRREFLGTSALIGAGLMAGSSLSAAEYKTTLKKSLIGKPTEATLKSWKAAGFDGIESNDKAVSLEDAKKARKMAEGIGMDIQSMLWGWANFNDKDSRKVKECIEQIEHSLRACQAYGAKALLLVPCRVGGMAMPKPWEFDIEFCEETLKVTKVAKGDNAKYEEYIAAQNYATEATTKAVKSLIGAAEKAGVVIALENVWNNLWVKPKIFKAFVESWPRSTAPGCRRITISATTFATPIRWSGSRHSAS